MVVFVNTLCSLYCLKSMLSPDVAVHIHRFDYYPWTDDSKAHLQSRPLLSFWGCWEVSKAPQTQNIHGLLASFLSCLLFLWFLTQPLKGDRRHRGTTAPSLHSPAWSSRTYSTNKFSSLVISYPMLCLCYQYNSSQIVMKIKWHTTQCA